MKIEDQSPGYFTHNCDKPNCFFCENMGNGKRIVKYIEPRYQLWMPYEVAIIKADLSIIPDIPGRTYRQVFERRCRLGIDLGIKLPPITNGRNGKKIINLETGKEFTSIAEASKFTGLSYYLISKSPYFVLI